MCIELIGTERSTIYTRHRESRSEVDKTFSAFKLNVDASLVKEGQNYFALGTIKFCNCDIIFLYIL